MITTILNHLYPVTKIEKTPLLGLPYELQLDIFSRLEASELHKLGNSCFFLRSITASTLAHNIFPKVFTEQLSVSFFDHLPRTDLSFSISEKSSPSKFLNEKALYWGFDTKGKPFIAARYSYGTEKGILVLFKNDEKKWSHLDSRWNSKEDIENRAIHWQSPDIFFPCRWDVMATDLTREFIHSFYRGRPTATIISEPEEKTLDQTHPVLLDQDPIPLSTKILHLFKSCLPNF